GGELHEAGGQAHRFSRVGERGRPRQQPRLAAAVAVEVARGLLDQRHAFLEHLAESVGVGQPYGERDRTGTAAASPTADRGHVTGHGYSSPLCADMGSPREGCRKSRANAADTKKESHELRLSKV